MTSKHVICWLFGLDLVSVLGQLRSAEPGLVKHLLKQKQVGPCRDFNCVFDVSADELASNPMMVRVSQQMSLQGQTDCHKKVVAAITDAARDHSYLKPNGRLLFPTNVAVIATAQA